MYLMRILGTFLCFIPILSVLIEQNRSIWLMCLLALNAFIWPTLAWYRARNSAMPLVTEHQNLVLDAGAGILDRHDGGQSAAVGGHCHHHADRPALGRGVTLMRKAAITMVGVFLVTWLTQEWRWICTFRSAPCLPRCR